MNTENLKLLNQRPIAYYAIYKDLTTSTTAGVLLSQLMYWFSKKDKFYKTDEDIREETRLTASELKTAKSKIKDISFITITREGVPAKTYYKINWDLYYNSLAKFAKLESAKQPNSNSEIRQTITKTTTKKEREKDFYDDNKRAIEIYILEIFANDKTIENHAAYKKKIIEKFIKEDKATISVFAEWRFNYNLNSFNTSYKEKKFTISGVKGLPENTPFKYIKAEKDREKIKITFLEREKSFNIMFNDFEDIETRLKIVKEMKHND
jgi:hypothetical protein